LRRKSLEGGAGGESVKILLRVEQLEQQLASKSVTGIFFNSLTHFLSSSLNSS